MGVSPGHPGLDQIRVVRTGTRAVAVAQSRAFAGLANIRGRLEQLYGTEQEFAIANAPAGGAEVTLRVPYHLGEQRP